MGHVNNVPSSSLGESSRLDQWGLDPRFGKRLCCYAAHGGSTVMLKDVNSTENSNIKRRGLERRKNRHQRKRKQIYS